MVENKIIEEKEPEVEISVPETKTQGLVLFPKIDLSNVKIWNRKLRKWFQVKLEGLTLFQENLEKCWKCGFYRKYCSCQHKEKKKDIIIQFIKRRLNLLLIKYHKFMYLRLIRKADKFYYSNRSKSNEYNRRVEQHEKYHDLHRQFFELQINWKETEYEGINVSSKGGL